MSHLSDIAATLAPLHFAKLTVSGYDFNFTTAGANSIMGFASKANYSWENGGRIYFLGGTHTFDYLAQRGAFWYYDIPTNVAEKWDRPTGYSFHKYTGVSALGSTITLSAPDATLTVNSQVYVQGGTGFAPDAHYIISSVVSSTQFVLSANPTTGGASGSTASNGILYIDGRYHHMIQWNTIDPAKRQMLHVLPDRGVFVCTTDLANPSNIIKQEWTMVDSSTGVLGGQYAGAFELFPERNEHWWFAANAGPSTNSITPFNRNTLTWGTTIPISANKATLGLGSIYSRKTQSMIFWGGYNGSFEANLNVVRLNLDGTTTTLDNAPEQLTFTGYALAAEDPVTGDIVVFVDVSAGSTTIVHVYTLSPSTGHWARRTDIEANWPGNIGSVSAGIFGTTICTLWDKGLIFIFGAMDIWLYKHTANSWATAGPPKGLLPGNLSEVGFESFDADFKMANWDTANAPLHAEMLSRGHVWTSQSATAFNQVHVNVNADNEFMIPTRDTATYYAAGGGAASCRLDHFARVDQTSTGYYKGTIDRGIIAPYRYISPKSPDGNILYGQFRVRLDAGLLNTIYRKYYDVVNAAWSTPSAGSTQLDWAGGALNSAYVGRQIHITQGTNFVRGFYTIASVTNATRAVLNTSPTPAAAGSAGYGYVGGSPWIDLWRGTLSTSGVSDILIAPAGHPFYSPTIPVGEVFYLGNAHPNTGTWSDGLYTVAQYIDATHVRMDRNVVSGGAGVNGWGYFAGTANYKVMINFGNLPTSGSASSLEITLQELEGTGYLGAYGQQGLDGYGLNVTVPLIADFWHEITYRIEVRGATNEAASRVTMWIDGASVIDYQFAKIDWKVTAGAAPGDGIGQYYLTIATTKKDPAHQHVDGHIWYDDLILSRQPIPFGSSATVAPTLPAAPCLPWFLRT